MAVSVSADCTVTVLATGMSAPSVLVFGVVVSVASGDAVLGLTGCAGAGDDEAAAVGSGGCAVSSFSACAAGVCVGVTSCGWIASASLLPTVSASSDTMTPCGECSDAGGT